MNRRTFKILILTLGIATLVPWGSVSALSLGGPAPSPRQGFFASLWGSFSNLWSGAGCELDPDGRCISSHSAAATARTDRGTGRLVNVRGAAGCELDPNGLRVQGQGPTCGATVTSGSIAPATR